MEYSTVDAATTRREAADEGIETRPRWGAIPAPRRPESSAADRVLLLALPTVAFVVVALLTFANSSDDPLITLRYAYNLLHHGQPTYNLGEHVEGYSSPLHLLVATAVLILPGGFELFKLKLVSLAFGAAALWQTGRFAHALCLPRWARLATLVSVAGSWNFLISSSNGLETSMMAFLATGTAVSLAGKDRTGGWRRSAVWAGLLAVARPDAVLAIALLGAVSFARRSDGPWWHRLRWVIGPTVTLAALLAFRLVYYHALVPNTYFAKQLGLGASIVGGVWYILSSQPLADHGLGTVVLILEAWLITIGARCFLRTRPAVGFALAIVVAETAFVFTSGGDWMKGGRFLMPVIPAGSALIFLGVEALVASLKPNTRQRRISGAVVAFGTVAILVLPSNGKDVAPTWRLSSGIGDRALIADGGYPLSHQWASAVELGNCLRPGSTVAYSEAGIFGYDHPNLRVLDTRGLTDRQIAKAAPPDERHPWGVEDDAWYREGSTVGRILLRRRPEMIISFDRSVSGFPGTVILGGIYRRAAAIAEPPPHSPLFVYLRNGIDCASVSLGRQS